jgi:hypothetical protein
MIHPVADGVYWPDEAQLAGTAARWCWETRSGAGYDLSQHCRCRLSRREKPGFGGAEIQPGKPAGDFLSIADAMAWGIWFSELPWREPRALDPWGDCRGNRPRWASGSVSVWPIPRAPFASLTATRGYPL